MKKNLHNCSQLVFCNSSVLLHPPFTQLTWEVSSQSVAIFVFGTTMLNLDPLSFSIHRLLSGVTTPCTTSFSCASLHLACRPSQQVCSASLSLGWQPYLSLGCPWLYWIPEYSRSRNASELHGVWSIAFGFCITCTEMSMNWLWSFWVKSCKIRG